MEENITPKEWLKQNKGKTLNDYYREKRHSTTNKEQRTDQSIEEPESETNKKFKNQENITISIPRPSKTNLSKTNIISIVIAIIGLVGFFLPWVEINLMGYSLASMNGYNFPKIYSKISQISDLYNNTSSSSALNRYYILYLIPILFAFIAYANFMNKKTYQFFLTLVILGCIGFLIVGLVNAFDFKTMFNFIGIGLYLSLLSAIVLLFLELNNTE